MSITRYNRTDQFMSISSDGEFVDFNDHTKIVTQLQKDLDDHKESADMLMTILKEERAKRR